jgi:hypothetical protein
VTDDTSLRGRRAAEVAALLDVARDLREQMTAPTVVYAFGGRDGTFAEATLTRPPAAAQRDLMAAYAAAVNAHMRLDHHDSDTRDLSSVDAWLGAMLGQDGDDA